MIKKTGLGEKVFEWISSHPPRQLAGAFIELQWESIVGIGRYSHIAKLLCLKIYYFIFFLNIALILFLYINEGIFFFNFDPNV